MPSNSKQMLAHGVGACLYGQHNCSDDQHDLILLAQLDSVPQFMAALDGQGGVGAI